MRNKFSLPSLAPKKRFQLNRRVFVVAETRRVRWIFNCTKDDSRFDMSYCRRTSTKRALQKVSRFYARKVMDDEARRWGERRNWIFIFMIRAKHEEDI